MLCEKCESSPCTCTKAHPDKPKKLWTVAYCQERGCDVRIRVLPGVAYNPRCKWHQAGTAYHTKSTEAVRQNDGPLLSLDEFGGDLFDAMALQSQMNHSGSTPALEAQFLAIIKKDTIAPSDLRRLLAMRQP